MNHRLAVAVVGLALPWLCGCDILLTEINYWLGQDIIVPVAQEGPEMTVNVDEEVTKIEDGINQKKDSAEGRSNYEILKALCETEPNKNCEPARFPARIPRYLWPYGCFVTDATTGFKIYKEKEQCTDDMACEETDIQQLQNVDPTNLPTGNGCIDVSDWVAQVPGFSDLTTVARATKMDFSEKGSLEDSKQVKKVHVDEVIVHFKSNSLTYPIPSTGTYVGAPVSEAEANDAKALISNGTVVLFGELTETAAAFTGDKSMTMNSEGQGLLSDAVKGFRATIAAQTTLDVPPDTVPEQADNCRHADHLPNGSDPCEGFPKPGGQATFTVEIALTFTINIKGQ
jgi:hypothetical protein